MTRSNILFTLILGALVCAIITPQAATAEAIVVPTEQPTTQQDRDAFLGVYNPVSGCVASATCCCSNTPMTITAGTATKDIVLSGTTDGTAACMGQTTLQGTFTLYQPLAAYSYISFVPVLFQLETDPTHKWIQLNTTKTSCNNVFQRVDSSTVSDIVSNPTQAASTIVSNLTQGQITIPTTTTSLPSTTTNPFVGQTGSTIGSNVLFPGFNLTALPQFGQNPFASTTNQQQQQVAFPAVTTDTLSQPPNFSQPPFGNLPSFPLAQQQQNTGTVTTQQQQQQQQQQTIPPLSTSLPFNTNLPLPGSTSGNPFSINGLTAVPAAGNPFNSTSTATSATSSPFPQLPTIGSSSTNPFPQIGGSNSPLPQLPGMNTNGQVQTQSTSSSSTGANLPSGLPSSPIGGFSTAAANSTVQYTQQLVEAANTGAPTASKNYLAAFTVPASSNVKFVILHWYSLSDMRQKNVYMNLTSSVGLASQLIAAASASPALTPASSYYVFVHGPITIENSDALTYSFTYSTKSDGSGAMNTPSYSYSKDGSTTTLATVNVPQDAVASLPGVNITDTSATDQQTSSSSTIDMTSIWNGRFQADSSCVPSDTCCCGVGIMNVSTTTADPSEVLLTGALDGGAGCLYQTSLTGLMKVNSTNPNIASRSIEIPNAEKTRIVFTAQLSTPQQTTGTSSAAANSVLTISNTFRPCATVAQKISSYSLGPISNESNTDPDTIQTNTNNSTTSSNSSSSTEPLARDAFVGDYDFDTSCVPSESCCCAQGPLNIAPVYPNTVLPPLPPAMQALAASNANASSSTNYTEEIIFSALLDGGSACVGMKNVSQVFKVVSPTSASFSFPPLTLFADLSSSSATSPMDIITFKNSLYPTCISAAKKRPITQQNNSSSTTTTPVTTPTNTTVPVTTPTDSSTLTDAQMKSLRDSYIGEWESTGCSVSASCCCTTGITTITANNSAPNLVNVDTALTGSGFSCLQKDGPVKMTFTFTNSTSAEASPFPSSTVKFHASQASEDKEKIIVSNSVHPTCPTTLVRRVPVNGTAAVIQTNTYVLAATLLGGALAAAFTH